MTVAELIVALQDMPLNETVTIHMGTDTYSPIARVYVGNSDVMLQVDALHYEAVDNSVPLR